MSALTKRAPSFFNPIRTAGWSAVGLILLTPLAAMQITSEVAWDAQDFLFAAVLLINPVVGVVVTPVSILAITAVYSLEVLVCLIQAYVFTILTCVYLKDALHPGH